jgi:GT2 family glycosyltransferase
MEDLSQQSVYVLIPVHNRKTISLDCLQNLKQTGDLEKYQIVVIDDGSSDGTGMAIREQYPQVKVLEGDGDLWWSGAIAKGMNYAYQQGAKHIIWLNDDCLPEKDALQLMVNFLETHPTTFVSASSYVAGSELPESTGVWGRKRLFAQSEDVVYVQGMSGFCVGMTVEIYKHIGTPDFKRFPHYYADVAYTLKATRSGFSAAILGAARVKLTKNNEPIHSFKNYYHKVSNYSLLFWSCKSPYYLPSQYFYHIEKYGRIPGIALFSLKLISWFTQWLLLSVSRTVQS